MVGKKSFIAILGLVVLLSACDKSNKTAETKQSLKSVSKYSVKEKTRIERAPAIALDGSLRKSLSAMQLEYPPVDEEEDYVVTTEQYNDFSFRVEMNYINATATEFPIDQTETQLIEGKTQRVASDAQALTVKTAVYTNEQMTLYDGGGNVVVQQNLRDIISPEDDLVYPGEENLQQAKITGDFNMIKAMTAEQVKALYERNNMQVTSLGGSLYQIKGILPVMDLSQVSVIDFSNFTIKEQEVSKDGKTLMKTSYEYTEVTTNKGKEWVATKQITETNFDYPDGTTFKMNKEKILSDIHIEYFE
jgi:hypothetical protein